MMKKVLCKCLSAYLMVYLAFGAALVFADDWDGFDDFVMPEYTAPEPAPFQPAEQPQFQSFDEPQTFESAVEQPQFYDTPSASEYVAPSFEPTPQTHFSHEPLESFDSFFSGGSDNNNQSGNNYVTIIRSNRLYESTFQDAVIEGLQFIVEPAAGVEDEITVTCYFIFRDKPTSYFYDLNRKDKKLIFEFADARTGSAPVRVDEQSPIKGITIEELQVDANKEIKGLNPEWHNYIRITMELEHVPVVSVSDESSIVSFRYKWTTNSEKYPEYIEPNNFPLVFWLSAGGLGAIGVGLLTYFLIPKKEKVVDPTLCIGGRNCDSPLPERPASR